MEMPFWCPFEGHKINMTAGNYWETSGVYFGYVKTFHFSAELGNISIDTFLNIFRPKKTQGESMLSCT